MNVLDLLKDHSGDFYTVATDDTVAMAIQKMSGYGVSAVVVMTGEKAEGIFTERDLVRCHILFPKKSISEILIKDVMTATLIVAEPEDTVDDAMAMMIQGKIRHLPVVGEKKIIALICLEDLVKAHVGALTRELHYLKDYITDLQDAAHD
ncbi:MAG: CBS domain-containing protein [Desulfobacterales bacterium]|nr:CBS domain-containing protein [Desulfobacterales bacterium]